MRWLAKLFERERRRSRRFSNPPVNAFYWDGGLSTPHKVANLSHHGLYIRTEDRWYPRTLIRVTLQRKSSDIQMEEESIMLLCRVVRTDEEGIGMAIVIEDEDKSEFRISLGSQATRKELNKFIERLFTDPSRTRPNKTHPDRATGGLSFLGLGKKAGNASPTDSAAPQRPQ